jgi:uncharacterized membrane protein
MKASSRPLPDWLKWVMRVSGLILPLCSLLFVSRIWLSISALRRGYAGPKTLSSQAMQTVLVQLAADVTIVLVLVALGIWLFRRSVKRPAALPAVDGPKAVETTPGPDISSKPSRRAANKRWHSCNVLQAGPALCQLWQFDSHFALSREQTSPKGEPLPGSLVKKTWGSLWQPKLNIAWLPPENVFLRVVHLPQSSFDETLSMVELQLEKLSPIPVTQVVWSAQVLPQSAGPLQTLIVAVAERKAVEEFLGQLEGQGYLADRLELGALDQLQATPVHEDGAWIYPGGWGGQEAALVAWWYGGLLQNLNFITLSPTEHRAAGLKEQLAQMTWAGELEGWLTSPPQWHLVADDIAARAWETSLREGLGEPVVVSAPLNSVELAALTARRAVQADSPANLLPVEYVTRYRQQFVDQLWLRGLGAIGAVYAVGVAVYFAALAFQLYRVHRVESEVKELSQTYTNAVQLKARYQVLQDRQDLKFAALDCWRKLAELLPETVTLDGFNLVEGRKLTLNGTAPSSEMSVVLDFVKGMRKATANGQPMFDQAKPEQFNSHPNPGGSTTSWNFTLELKRGEAR